LRGVSSVLGAVILAAIVFTVLIPLLIFLQNTTTLYHLQVLERNRAEIERFQENLEIHATVSPDKNLYLLVRNKGSLAANLTSIYVADSAGGLTIWNLTENSVISPLSPIIPIKLDVKAEEDKSYTIHAATERGKSYAAAEKPLNLTDPPYLLQVSLLDMSYGENYGIRVEVTGINGGDKIGCIRIEGSGSTCNAEAEVQYRSERWNDNQTFVFKVMPGAYELTVWNQSYTYPKQTLIILGNEAKIYRFGHTPPCPSGDCCIDMGKSLRINITAPEVIMAGSNGTTPILKAYVIIELAPSAREAVKNLKVKLDCTDPMSRNDMCSDVSIEPSEITVDHLKPRQTIALRFNITVNLGPYGDYFSLIASIVGGTGVRSGFSYVSCNYMSEKVSVTGCRLTTIKYINCTGWLDPNCKKSTCESNPDCEWVGILRLCICTSNVIPRCKIPPSS